MNDSTWAMLFALLLCSAAGAMGVVITLTLARRFARSEGIGPLVTWSLVTAILSAFAPFGSEVLAGGVFGAGVLPYSLYAMAVFIFVGMSVAVASWITSVALAFSRFQWRGLYLLLELPIPLVGVLYALLLWGCSLDSSACL